MAASALRLDVGFEGLLRFVLGDLLLSAVKEVVLSFPIATLRKRCRVRSGPRALIRETRRGTRSGSALRLCKWFRNHRNPVKGCNSGIAGTHKVSSSPRFDDNHTHTPQGCAGSPQGMSSCTALSRLEPCRYPPSGSYLHPSSGPAAPRPSHTGCPQCSTLGSATCTPTSKSGQCRY